MIARPLVALALALLVARPALADDVRSPDEIADALLALSPDAPPEQRAALQTELAAAKQRVATVVVKVEALGQPAALAREGTVVVDGRERRDLPLARPLYLAPGKHTVAIEVTGRQFIPIEADFAASQNVAVTVREVEKKAAPPPAPSDDKPLWPGILMASIGAAGIGTGIGLIVVSVGKSSDAEALGDEIGTCDPSQLSAACSDLAGVVADRNAFQNGAVVAFAVGGVAALASLAYFAIPTPSESVETTQVSITPAIGPSLWGLAVGGKF